MTDGAADVASPAFVLRRFQLTGPLIFKALACDTLASALLAALDVQQGPALQDRVGGFVGELSKGGWLCLPHPLQIGRAHV